MARLLVSVRNSDEAVIGCDARISILDIKEPNHGSLGRATDECIASIVQVTPSSIPISVAYGELSDAPPPLAPELSRRIEFAKVGLAGMALQAWQSQWHAWRTSLGNHLQPVMVAYADWQEANAPCPRDVLTNAQAEGCQWMLIDTFAKNGSTLLTTYGLDATKQLIQQAHEFGIQIAVAGSLGISEIDQLLPFAPDIIAVRGAVCAGDRNSSIDASKTRQLQNKVTAHTFASHVE